MSHKIQVDGVAAGQDPGKVTVAFARLFRLPEEKAAQVLARAPLVIKEGLDAATAEKYRFNLEGIGLDVRVIAPPDMAALALDLAAEAAEGSSGLAPETVPTRPLAADMSSPPAPPVSRAPAIPAGHPSGLSFRIDGRPDFAFLTVQLPAGKTLKVEASAMATMDTSLRMKTRLRGGISRLLTGESLFINEFTAETIPGEIGIAPAAPGDLGHVYLQDETIYLQNSAFVACDPAVTLETKWQGFTKGFFSGESFFLVRASGVGDLWFNTYGGLIELDVDGDYVVDSGNIVAFTDGLDYSVGRIGGYKSLFFSGEGFVCRFKGKGKVWIQTRAAGAFISWANWYRPVQKSG